MARGSFRARNEKKKKKSISHEDERVQARHGGAGGRLAGWRHTAARDGSEAGGAGRGGAWRGVAERGGAWRGVAERGGAE
jgi:hypothetical protein